MKNRVKERMRIAAIFKQIKYNLSFREIVKKVFGIEELCPLCKEINSFHINEKENVFYCCKCEKGGDLIAFMCEYEHCSTQEALKLLSNFLPQ